MPKSWEDRSLITFHPDIEYLRFEGEFRPFRPEELIQAPEGREKRKVLEKEFMDIVTKSPLFNTAPRKEQQNLSAHIYQDKVSSRLYSFLEKRGLAKIEMSGEWQGWFRFEEKVAHLYMSLLAKYLAELDYEFTTCGTDNEIYEKLNFAPLPKSESVRCLNVWFHKVLPVPREDVSFNDIIEFKHHRHIQLSRLRQEIDKFQKEITETSTKSEITEVLVKFKESMEIALSDLNATLRDHRIATISGTLKTLINVKAPAFWGGIAQTVGHSAKIAELPFGSVVPRIGTALVAAGVIEVGSFLLGKRNEKNTKLRENGFSYLLQAQNDGIV